MRTITLVLADDHEIFRDGFKTLLKKQKDIEFVGEASNGKELIELVEMKKPDIVVTDIQMPIMDGIEATRLIRSKHPSIGIIALSMHLEESLIVEAVEAGVNGYLSKNVGKQELIEAIKTVKGGESYYCKSISKKLLERLTRLKFQAQNLKPHFTERELEVMKLICKEFTNKDIATALSLSSRTVEGIRESIQKKIGAKNTAGIVVYVIKNRIIDLE
jgi:DNA-binding NarL/FixJ family response regulator